METRTVVIILDNTCGRIAHTIERTEEIPTTRTLEEDSKEEVKEEDSKAEDSKDVDSKDAGSKEADSTQIRVEALEEAAEMTSTSMDMDMEKAIAAPLLPINQDSQAGIVITAMDNTMDNICNRCITVHHMIRYRILQIKDGTDNQKWLMVKDSHQNQRVQL